MEGWLRLGTVKEDGNLFVGLKKWGLTRENFEIVWELAGLNAVRVWFVCCD